MAEVKITGLTALAAIDRTADVIEIVDISLGVSRKATINYILGFTGGNPVSTSDTQSLTNKTLDNTNVISVLDNSFTLQDNASPTKQAQFQLSGITAGQTRVFTLPDYNATIATLTGTETLTNKTINNPTLNTDTVNEFSSGAGVTIDGVLLKDNKMNGSYITDSSVNSAQAATGFTVQRVGNASSAVGASTTTTPADDTIPQNTEGTEFLSQAITPKSASNILYIEAVLFTSYSTSAGVILALFQDANANAIAASEGYIAVGQGVLMIVLKHTMTAGTTSATTFKVRAGSNTAGTITVNGVNSSRRYGAISKSSLFITEVKG